MLRARVRACASLLLLVFSVAVAQQSTSTGNGVVPMLVNFSGVLAESGKPQTGTVGVTFALYKDFQGGAPLWLETQNVQPDKFGHYSVVLGSTLSGGMPANLFVSGEARWLGVQPQDLAEQPRVLLLSVPYALKAADAETVGGLPPSAFVLAVPNSAGSSSGSSLSSNSNSNESAPPSVSGGGTAKYLPLWTSSTKLGTSVLFQSGTGGKAEVGIGTTKPASTLDVNGSGTIRGLFNLPATGTATNSAGFNSQPIDLVASVFNSSTSTPVTQTFQWQAEPVGNDTSNATGSLNLLFGQGTSQPSETGLNIASNGRITFASGQTFPGTGNGTITGVTAGSGLTGGGNSGNVTLGVPAAAITNSMLQNSAVTVNAGTGLRGGGPVLLGGNTTLSADPSQVPLLNASTNWFNGNQVVNWGSCNYCITLGAGSLIGISAPSGSNGGGQTGVYAEGGNGDPLNDSYGGAAVTGYGGSGIDNSGNGSDGQGAWLVGGFNSAYGDGAFAVAGTGFAGNFDGNVFVAGNLSAYSKNFKIDHPLDPANKYLVHASVESSEMMNIYTGNVTTDAEGEATVQLADWFEVLNTDFRYQLTVIGQFAQAIVAQKINNNHFTIRSSAPNVEVSWQVTGVRQDAYAKAHPLVVEEEKDARLRGFYLQPELYGAPDDKQIEWARHPQMMDQLKRRRKGQQSNAAMTHLNKTPASH